MNLTIRESKKSEGLFFIFIEGNELPVGSLDYEDGWIQNFGIDTQYQKRGIGQAALKHFLTLISERPIKLDVMKNNKRAIHVYKNCGFEISFSSRFFYVMELKS